MVVEQTHPDAVFLSHFEVVEISPRTDLAQLTDLCVGELGYLVVPVPLLLLEREQQRKCRRAEREALLRALPLLSVLGLPRVLQLIKSDRRATRLTSLDVVWRPRQPLIASFKNFGTTAVDEVSIELVLYSLDGSLPVGN